MSLAAVKQDGTSRGLSSRLSPALLTIGASRRPRGVVHKPEGWKIGACLTGLSLGTRLNKCKLSAITQKHMDGECSAVFDGCASHGGNGRPGKADNCRDLLLRKVLIGAVISTMAVFL